MKPIRNPIKRAHRLHPAGPHHQRGTNLIEVMVAMSILSIGLLGLAMLQLQGLKHNTDAYLRTQATFLASELMERIRVNLSSAGAYVSDSTTAPAALPSPDCKVTYCTGAQIAQFDLWHWSQALSVATSPTTGLPEAEYALVAVTGNQYKLTISWRERAGAKGSEDSSAVKMSQDWIFDL